MGASPQFSGMDSAAPGFNFPWEAWSVPPHPLREEPSPKIQPKHPLTQLQLLPQVPAGREQQQVRGW